MEIPIPEIDLYLVGAAVSGLVLGWAVRSYLNRRRIRSIDGDWKARFDDLSWQRDRLAGEAETLRSSRQEEEAAMRNLQLDAINSQKELEAALEREQQLNSTITAMQTERETFKVNMETFQKRTVLLQQQSMQLKAEFDKAREFYVAELKKSHAKCKAVEAQLAGVVKEHESYRNQLQSSNSERDSVSKSLAAAKTRLVGLDALERRVTELEEENALLRRGAEQARQEANEAMQSAHETQQLKIQNEELSQVVKTLKAGNEQTAAAAPHQVPTNIQDSGPGSLSSRLAEVERNFKELEQQQNEVLQDARKSSTMEMPALVLEPENQPAMNGADDDSLYKQIDSMRCADLKVSALKNCVESGMIVNTGTILSKGVNETVIKKQVGLFKDLKLRVPPVLRFRTVGLIGRHQGEEAVFTKDEFYNVICDQLGVDLDYIEKNTVPVLNNTSGTSFSYENVIVRLVDWTVDNDGVPDSGNTRRGRITANWKLAPFFEDVKKNEFGY